jgi:hypothetical protein
VLLAIPVEVRSHSTSSTGIDPYLWIRAIAWRSVDGFLVMVSKASSPVCFSKRRTNRYQRGSTSMR